MISTVECCDCMEVFRQISYDKRYLISSKGRVYSTATNKFLKLQTGSHGYFSITISNYQYNVHRLVAEHFLAKGNYICVNHKDGNKKNNNIDNLEWCKHSENLVHAYDMGLNKKVRSVARFSLDGTLIERYKSARGAEKQGFRNQLISKCCTGKRLTHGGYTWKFV